MCRTVQTLRPPSFYYYALISGAKCFQNCRRKEEQKDQIQEKFNIFILFPLCYCSGRYHPIEGYLFLILRWNKNGSCERQKTNMGSLLLNE